jgi:hypothetical protein
VTFKVVASALLCHLLLGCAATGPYYRSPDPTYADNATCVVYRISQFAGTMGSWVPTRLEINGNVVGKLPDQSFMAIEVPPGEVTLSTTDMINLHYADAGRITLRDKIAQAEIAYFRLTSVFGSSCTSVQEGVEGAEVVSVTYHIRLGGFQTSCLQRVPEGLALKELKALRKAD